jgi:autotransporter-associated beta strand protein
MNTPIADNSPSIGNINQNGAGTTVLAVDNQFSGTMTITTGVLEPESLNALPTSDTNAIFIVGNSATGALGLTGIGITNITNAISMNGRPAINTASILNVSGNNTISGPITVNTGGTNYDIESDAGTLTMAGTLAPSSGVTGTRVISLLGTTGGVGNWTSVITNGGTPTFSVEKTEAGVWSLSNTNTYSGGTIVGGGTLNINANGATGSGNVTMQGGTLASTAGTSYTIPGSVVDGATASYTIAPGGVGTIGTLNIGGLTTSSLGTLSFQLGTGSGTVTNGSVLLLGSGTVTIGSGTLISVTGTPTVGKDYRIIGGTISGIESQESDFVLPQVGSVGFVFNNTVDSGFIDLQAITAGPASLTWNDASADNQWNITSSNWNSGTGTTTYSNGANVTFNDNNGGNYSVTLGTSVTPASVTVNNSSGNYSIGGSGTITGTTALSKSGSGKVTLGTVNSYTGGTNVAAGTLVVGVNGALPSGAVNITGGTLQLAASTGLATITSLAISGSGTFDVNNNHVIINYGSGPDPIASIAALLASGYSGGSWAGTSGIVSTAAAANSFSYGLGYADSVDTGNPANLSSGQIEIKYTLLGDANLDGVVNAVDFGILAANFNKGVTGWDKGDFNYDNVVNAVDFGELAANFNKGATGTSIGLPAYDDPALVAFAAANGLLADVPEPATAGLLVVAGLGVLGRRRRRTV